jgi:glycosyltransferase involved in cell wall biosynthesis
MSNVPLVSVVIPTYNRARSVVRAIESAQRQSYPNIEIVVTDNASTDGTEEVVRALAEKDRRIRYFRNEQNLGPVPNWKKGIQLAQGEYVKILFSDDSLEPHAVHKMITVFQQHGDQLGFVYSRAFLHHIGLDIIYGPTHQLDKPIPIEEYFDATASRFSESIFTPCMALFRRKDLLKNFTEKIPHTNPQLRLYWHQRGIGYDAILYWRTAACYPYIYAIEEPLIHLYSYNLDTIACITAETEHQKLIQGYLHAFKFWLSKYAKLDKETMINLYARVFWFNRKAKKSYGGIRTGVRILKKELAAGLPLNLRYFVLGYFLVSKSKKLESISS